MLFGTETGVQVTPLCVTALPRKNEIQKELGKNFLNFLLKGAKASLNLKFNNNKGITIMHISRNVLFST